MLPVPVCEFALLQDLSGLTSKGAFAKIRLLRCVLLPSPLLQSGDLSLVAVRI